MEDRKPVSEETVDRQATSEQYSREDLRQIITSIKRASEREFQEKLKTMAPEEQEATLEWAQYMD